MGSTGKRFQRKKTAAICSCRCKEGLFRYFRLMQTQRGFTDEYGFSLRKIELFGTLYESEYVPKGEICTNNNNERFLQKTPFLITLIIYGNSC